MVKKLVLEKHQQSLNQFHLCQYHFVMSCPYCFGTRTPKPVLYTRKKNCEKLGSIALVATAILIRIGCLLLL